MIDDALAGWGSPAGTFGDPMRAAYVQALRDPDRVHAICEECRAAATLDRAHDEADRTRARRIAGPLLALWSEDGARGTWAHVGRRRARRPRSGRPLSSPRSARGRRRRRWRASSGRLEPGAGVEPATY